MKAINQNNDRLGRAFLLLSLLHRCESHRSCGFASCFFINFTDAHDGITMVLAKLLQVQLAFQARVDLQNIFAFISTKNLKDASLSIILLKQKSFEALKATQVPCAIHHVNVK